MVLERACEVYQNPGKCSASEQLYVVSGGGD